MVYERAYGSAFHNARSFVLMSIAIAVINVLAYIYLLSYLILDIYRSKWKRIHCKLLGFTVPKLKLVVPE
jgi:hypothetical protein